MVKNLSKFINKVKNNQAKVRSAEKEHPIGSKRKLAVKKYEPL